MACVAYCLPNEHDALEDALSAFPVKIDRTVFETDPVTRPALDELIIDLGATDVLLAPRLTSLGSTVQQAHVNITRFHVAGTTVWVLEQKIEFTDEKNCPATRALAAASLVAQAADRARLAGDLAAAGEAGIYSTGRPREVNETEMARLLAQGLRPSQVAKQLGCSRMTVWRYQQQLNADPQPGKHRPKREIKPTAGVAKKA